MDPSNVALLKVEELERRMNLLEQVTAGQRQLIDVLLLSIQRFAPPPSVPIPQTTANFVAAPPYLNNNSVGYQQQQQFRTAPNVSNTPNAPNAENLPGASVLNSSSTASDAPGGLHHMYPYFYASSATAPPPHHAAAAAQSLPRAADATDRVGGGNGNGNVTGGPPDENVSLLFRRYGAV